MPFTVSPAAYRGGDYLFQGITNAAQGITGAINQWTQVGQQADQADALMKYLSQQTDPVTGKPVISSGALQDFQQHNMRQRAAIAGAMSIGMPLVQSLQHYATATREGDARTNLYNAQAVAARATDAAPQIGQVWDPTSGRYVSVFQHGKTAQVLQPQAGTPGSIVYHPQTGKPVGFYDNKGYHSYAAPGLDISGLFGGDGTTTTDQGTAAAPQATPGATGPQPTDQAYSAQGDPGNLPPIYRQQPGGQPPAGAQAQTAQVHVMHPDGKTDGYIPASQLPAALQQGYRQL